MDEKQLQMLFNEYAKGKGFKDFGEFKSLMEDEGSRKVFFEDSNKELGFKDFNDFNATLGVKKKEPAASSATPSRLPKVLEQGANIVSGGILSDISKSVPATVKEEKRGRSKYDQIKGNENRFLDIGTPASDPNFGKNKAGLMMAQVPNSERASWGMEAIKKGELQGKIANILPVGKRPTQDELWAVSEIQSELSKMPESKAGAAFKQDGWEIFKKDPLLGAEFLGETVLSSLSALFEAGKRTIPTAIGMGAAMGAPIAGIGAIGGALTGITAGMTTAGMNLSTSGKIIDVLSQEGVDVTDRQSLIDAFSDEKRMSKIRERGLKYGIPIAAFDAISGGVAGKLVSGAAGKSLLRKTLAGFGEAGIQSLGNMAGEASGQYLSDGKLNRDEILLEGVAGLVTDVPEIISGAAIEKLKTPSSNKKILAKQVAVLGNEIGADDAKYNLNRDLANGIITPEEHEKGVAFVEKAVEVNNKIPDYVQGLNRATSIELIDERDRLIEELNQREEQKKGIDVAYHKFIDESNKETQKRIDEINNRLGELSKPEKNIIKPDVKTESLEYGGSKYYITDNDGNQIGSAEVSTVDDKIIIDNLFVDEKNKRKGLATSILDKIIEDFKGRNYEYIDQNDVEFSIPYKIEVGTVVSEEGQAFSNSVRKKIEEFNKNQEKGVLPKEEIQQPIEGSPDLPEGYEMPSQEIAKQKEFKVEDAREINVLSMLKESKILSPTEKSILYRQYKMGVMNENDISKYTNVDVADLKNDNITKWARVILDKTKAKKIDAEDIDFEEINEVPNENIQQPIEEKEEGRLTKDIKNIIYNKDEIVSDIGNDEAEILSSLVSRENISPEDAFRAFDGYKKNDYKIINEILRRGEEVTAETIKKIKSYVPESLLEDFGKIKRVLDNTVFSPIKKTTFYRNIFDEKADFLNDYKVGDEFTDKGISSATIDEAFANEANKSFSESKKSKIPIIKYEIDNGESINGFYIGGTEKEFLINSGTKFIVTKKENIDGRLIITLKPKKEVVETKTKPEIVESVRVEQEPELPEGTKVVTLSGMQEGERVKAVEERKKKTTLTEKEKLHNDLIDLANRVQKSRGNEKTNLQGQIRQRVRELNAKAGEEIYKYDGVSVRAKVKSKTKGERYLKIKGTTRDTSGRAIKEDAVLLFDRSPEFVQKYEELADSPNITALQVDSGNGVTMTAEQIESALQDIADGIPSVQADNLLNALEEGFNRGYFDLRGKDIGQDRVQASVEDFIGVQQEEVGQPMDEEALMEYLDDESQFSPEEDEQIFEDFKNLINEYESQPQKTVIEREVPKAKPAAEVGSPKPTQPNEKGKADGEPKADISKEPIGEAKPKQENVEDWSKDVESTAKALEGDSTILPKYKKLAKADTLREKLNATTVFEGGEIDLRHPNNRVAWRSMGANEFARLLNGEEKGGGVAKKGDWFSNYPKRAAQQIGEGKYLVEFSGVDVEGETIKQKVNKDFVTGIWKYENGEWNKITPNRAISEAYHKSKADGSNPELIKAVEDLLGKPQEQKAEPKKEEVEPKSPLEQQYEEASQKKGEKAQQKAKEKLISDNFDGIVAQLMTKNKIKRKC